MSPEIKFNEKWALIERVMEDTVTNHKEVVKAMIEFEKEMRKEFDKVDKRLDKVEQDMVEVKTKVKLYAAGIAFAVGVAVKYLPMLFGG